MRISDWSSDVCSSDLIRAEARLKQLFGVATLDGFGRFGRADLAAAGGLIAYLEAVGRGSIPHLAPPQKIEPQDVMAIDPATRESLEIARSSAGARGGSLLDCIDRTVSGGGARLLGTDLSAPLTRRRSEEHTSELQSLMRISYAV